jgi:hypothetical protein
MKKKVSYLIIVLLLSLFTSTMRASDKNSVINNAPTTEIPVEIKTMLNRLDEIKAMDKSDLKSYERKELRKEVREIKSKVRASGNGLYISSGAIIIILLLIIIL